ncbi:CPBP family intramembrane glutamic endopeptidase [Streptococcus sp. CSL10205-OR2]|uniref:CPBP family intramembrane glutamic endopeptidase n=1 Tax=Streptococcus sp. CSL10205-OR2 TaxID=2980558 RepID=UPI0021DA797B|nr:type II CAAX endopeptidase family protein [Streptococcus sp. CSL10205-OR2]MCU9533994.1 CPBP family intramembrane metalloprotease [Streptococcus sp. CSL10205-OR2]
MNKLKSIAFGILVLLLWTGVLILGQIPIGFFVSMNQLVNSDFDLFQIIVTVLIQLATIFAFLYFAIKKQFISLKEKLSPIITLLVVAIGYPVILLGSILGSLFISADGQATTDNQQIILDLISRVPMVIMFVMIVLAAPVMEELLFRKFLPHYLFKNRPTLGLIVGGILFALFHMPTNLGSFIIYGLMSTALTFVVYKTKRIEYSILLHFVNNLIAFFLIMTQMG